MKEIILDQLLFQNIPTDIKKEGYSFGDVKIDWIVRAMKEACKQTLELASENAKIREDAYGDSWVERLSILNTLEQIKEHYDITRNT